MAEGLAKSMFGSQHNIQSAGSIPSGKVHSHAILTMDEIGIDIRDQYSKSINDLDKDFLDNLDYAITLCAEEVCPVIPNTAVKLHWMNEDPANKIFNKPQLIAAFSKTREDLLKSLNLFLVEIS